MRRVTALLVLLVCAVACSRGEEVDWRTAVPVSTSADGKQVHLAFDSPQRGFFCLDVERGSLSRVDRPPPGDKGKPAFSFRMERDHLVITPDGAEAVRHYINDLPARVSRTSGLPVSRYHGKRGHFMQILGTFPGGVLVREPKRLHLGGGYADAYFPVSPEGTVGAEVFLPTADGTGNHKVLFLTRHGMIIAAVEHGRALCGIDARTGETRFTVR